jgi:ribonuclease P protein subunit RPR2
MVKDLARQRINQLFEMASKVAPTRPELADRYVDMALRLSRRIKVRIPKEWKYFVCPSCRAFLFPGRSSRVRIQQKRSPHTVVTCLRCGGIKRYAIKKKG